MDELSNFGQNAIQAAGSMFQSLKQGISNWANTPMQQPKLPGGTSVMEDLGGGLQQGIASMQQTQPLQINLPQPIQNIPIAGPIAEGIVNAPGQFLQGISRVAGDISSSLGGTGVGSNQRAINQPYSGQQPTIQNYLGDLAQTAQFPLMFTGVGEAAAGIGEAGLGQAIKTGVLQGAKFGAAQGGLQGLTANRDTSLPQQLLGAGSYGAQGAVLGGLTGGVVSGVGHGVVSTFGAVSDAISKAFPNADDATKSQVRNQFIRDEIGRFTKGPAKKEPVYYGDIRESLGLPRNGDYSEGGFIKLGRGLKVEDGVPNEKGLLPLGDSTGIEPEAKTKLEGLLPTIEKNRNNYDDPSYFGKTLIPEKDWNTYLDSHPEINNHGDSVSDIGKGPEPLRDMNGYLGYISTDRGTIPLDEGQSKAVIDNRVVSQWTANNGDQELAIVRRNQNMPTAYDVIDRHHGIPAARAIGLDKVPAIILHKDAPALSDVYDALKSGKVNPVDIKGGFPLDQQATEQKALQVPTLGEAALTPQKINDLAPELTTDAGKSKVQSILDKAKGNQPVFDERFKQIATDAGLDPSKDFESRVKQPETFVAKVAQHRLEGTEEYSASGVNDSYGGRFIADTPAQKGQIISEINQMERDGELKIEKQQQVTKDTYSAYHIDFIKNGVRGEIQIHDPNSYLESVVNHEIRAQAGEKPPPQLQAEKTANAQAASQMPPELAQPLAKAAEQAHVQDKLMPWEEEIDTKDLGVTPIDRQVPPQPEQPGTASPNPQEAASQARLARSGAMGAINVRAQTLASQMDSVLKTPEDNLNIRLAMESPERMNELAQKSANPQAFKDIAQKYSNFTDYIANQLKQTGGSMNFVQDYFTHIWDLSTPEAQQKFDDLMASNANNFRSGFTKERLVTTLQQGLDAGLKLQNTNASSDVVRYANSMGTQIGAQSFNQKINELRPGGAQPIGTTPYNYQGKLFQQSNVPGNQGTVIDPEIQRFLGRYNPSGLADNALISGKDIQIGDKTLHVPGIDEANQLLKQSKLGLGLFHALNTSLRQLLNNPLVIPRAIINSFSTDARNAFNQKAIDDGVIDFATKHGVTFDANQDILGRDKTLLDTVKSANPFTKFANAMFGGLINTYKVNLARAMMGKFPNAATDALQETQAKAYGAQINNLMGGLNYEALGRNKTVQQALRLVGLAPDFNEGILRQVLQAANPLNYANAGQRPAALFALKNVVGQVALYAGLAEVGRKLVTGNFSPDLKSFVANSILKPTIPLPDNATFNNPKTGKTQTANLPSSEFNVMAGAVNNPSHFLQARGSAITAGVGSLLSGKDYYGNPLVNAWNGTPDTLGNRAKALIPNQLPIPIQQLQKQTQGRQTPAVTALNTLGLRVTNNPNDPKTIATNQYFTALNQAAAGLNPNDQKTFLGVLHPTTKDPEGNSVIQKTDWSSPAKYDVLLSNPKVLAAEQAFQKSQASHDPMWDLNPNQLHAFLQYEVISKNDPGGDKTTTKVLTQALPSNFFAQRSAYYASLNLPPPTGPTAPQTSPQVSQFWSQYSQLPYGTGARSQALNTPLGQMALQQLNASQEFTNQQRIDMGLPPIAQTGTQAGGFSSTSKRGLSARLPVKGGAKSVSVTGNAAGKFASKGTGRGKLLAAHVAISRAVSKAPKVKFRGGSVGKVKGLSAKVGTAKIGTKAKQLSSQTFKMPALKKINLKQLGGGYHSPRYGKYTYQ